MKLLEFLDSIRENDSSGPGKFVGARLTRDSERAVMQWMRDNGLRKKEPRARLHITVIGSPDQNFDWNPATFDPPLEIDPHTYKLEKFGDDAIVLSFSVPELEKRHEAGCEKHGIEWKHPTYQPHLTLAFDPTGLNSMERLLKPTFPLYVASEYAQPWQFDEEDSRTERRRRIREDHEFLMERNMMNAPWAKEVAEQYATDTFLGPGGFTDLPHLFEWAVKALAKYLINDYPAATRINSVIPGDERAAARGQPGGTGGEIVGLANVSVPRVPQFGIVGGRDRDMQLSVPAWVPGALQRGDELYFLDTRAIQGTNGLPQQMTTVRDWLRHLARHEDPFVMQKGRINRISWAQALETATRWHEEMQARDSEIEELPEHKEKFLDVGDGAAWWKLTGESCLSREGEVMGHCVADYVEDVESGYATIFSLRDAKNEPHVTVEAGFGENEAADWVIKQVKGKENKAPVEKYWPYVDALLKHLWNNTNATNVTVEGEGHDDLEGCGILYFAGMLVRTNKNLNEAPAWMRATFYPEYVSGYEDRDEIEVEKEGTLEEIAEELSDDNMGEFGISVIPNETEFMQAWKWQLVKWGHWDTETETSVRDRQFQPKPDEEWDDEDAWIDNVPVSISVGLPGVEHEVLTGSEEEADRMMMRGRY